MGSQVAPLPTAAAWRPRRLPAGLEGGGQGTEGGRSWFLAPEPFGEVSLGWARVAAFSLRS